MKTESDEEEMGSLFSKPKTPAIPKPAPMPVPASEDELAKQKKRREAAAAVGTGRSSTILSEAQSETLG